MRLLCFFLAILAASPAAAQGFDLEAQLDVAGTTHFQGDADASILSGGLFYHHLIEPGQPTLSIKVDGARVRLVDFPLLVAQTSRDHPVPSESLSEALPPKEVLNEAVTGTIRLLDVEEDAMHYLLPDREGSVEHTLNGSLEAWIGPSRVRANSVYNFQQPRPATGHEHIDFTPQGTYGALSMDAWNVHVEHASFAFLHGGRIEITQDSTQTHWTGVQVERSAADPAGLHRVDVLHRYVMLVEGDLQADLAGTGWRSALRSVEGRWVGDFEFSNVASDSTVRGETLEGEMSLLQVMGDIEAHADYTDDASWTLGGEATFVGIDGQTVAGSRDGSLVAAVAAVGIVGLVWLLASQAGRHVLLVAGRHLAGPLGDPTRVQIMRSVSLDPGSTAGELARRNELHRSTVRHHLRILAAAGYVSGHKSGEQKVYTLSGGNSIHATAIWAHPTRQAILGVLREGEASYLQMRAAWQRMDCEVLGRDVVSYHGRHLEEAAMVSRTRVGRHVIWRLETDPRDVIERERGAYLVREGLCSVYEAVNAAGSCDEDQVRAQLARRGERVTRKRLRQMLRHLYAAGFIHEECTRGVHRHTSRLTSDGIPANGHTMEPSLSP